MKGLVLSIAIGVLYGLGAGSCADDRAERARLLVDETLQRCRIAHPNDTCAVAADGLVVVEVGR